MMYTTLIALPLAGAFSKVIVPVYCVLPLIFFLTIDKEYNSRNTRTPATVTKDVPMVTSGAHFKTNCILEPVPVNVSVCSICVM